MPLDLLDPLAQPELQENPEHLDLKDLEDLQETSTSMISFQLAQREHLVQLALMEPLGHQAHLAHQDPVTLRHMLEKDLESVEMDHSCTDHVDLQDHQDSQDLRVIWDFQEPWVQMERWVHRVYKAFQDKMDHQDLAEKLVHVD